MAFSRDKHPGKSVVDSIHGDIHLTDREVRIIDTSSFQRLRQLKQLAMSHFAYPNATHTRFAHSLGTLGIMIRVLESAQKNRINLTRHQKENLRLAALLHDIGHYPYSHLMETVDRVRLTEEQVEGPGLSHESLNAKKAKYPDHEELGGLIVENQPDLVKAIGGKKRAKEIANLFSRTEVTGLQLSKLIHSSLDLDRLDYLLRDSRSTGVPYGQIDINYLLNNLKISPEGMVGFLDKALPAVEHLLLARFFMYRAVYYHKTTYGLEEACRQLLRRLRDRESNRYGVPEDGNVVRNMVILPKLNSFTDAYIDQIVQKASFDSDKVIKALAKSIQTRTPPSLLKEVSVCEEKKKKHHAGTFFRQNCKSRLLLLSQEYKIPLGQFILCETKPLTIGEYPEKGRYEEITQLSEEQIRERISEEREKDIKVFVSGNDEPQSLVDMDHSLISKFSPYAFQIFRLYVIYEGPDKENIIRRLRDEVVNWDKD